jgi:DNA invertase Pin-like site-specific DNA recombinase
MSGQKGEKGRPGFAAMLKPAHQRKFDILVIKTRSDVGGQEDVVKLKESAQGYQRDHLENGPRER